MAIGKDPAAPSLDTTARHCWGLSRRIHRLPRYLYRKLVPGSRLEVVYIVEPADWSIRWDGINIARELGARGIRCSLDTSPFFHANKVVHFGSSGTFAAGLMRFVDSSNRIVLTFFHGDYGIDPAMDRKIDYVLSRQEDIDRLLVSTSIMAGRFGSWGFPAEKLALIPLGVDLRHFRPVGPEERLAARRRLGLPEDAVVVGSFQKDGNGWGEGLEPKLIKGPDVLVEAVGRLAEKYPVHCLLTGPARGFVKDRLAKLGISHTHRFLENPLDLNGYYHALDLYLVTSREEGGPKTIMEAMACGTPVVSTRVGMAPDVIVSGKNGYMVEVNDVAAMVEAAGRLLDNRAAAADITRQALVTVQDYGWSVISASYAKMYAALAG